MSDYRDQFNCKLDLILQGKNSNAVLPRKEKRDEWINRLLEVENDGPKHGDDYNLKRRYEVLKVGNENRLIRKRKQSEDAAGVFRFIAAFEEVYQIISAGHSAVGHGGEKKNSF